MQFDKEYFDKLYEFFNINNDVTYNVDDLSSDADKFIAYVRLYQHTRKLDEAEVLISFDEKQIRITEFFQNVLNVQKTQALEAGMYIGDLNAIKSTPFTQSIQPVLSNLVTGANGRMPYQQETKSFPNVQSQVKKSPFQK